MTKRLLLTSAFIVCAILTMYEWRHVFHSYYDQDVVEVEFARLSDGGFDSKVVNRLIAQYKLSDASSTLHFIAIGYRAYKQNASAFSQVTSDPMWKTICDKIRTQGSEYYHDWFGRSYTEPDAAPNRALRSR